MGPLNPAGAWRQLDHPNLVAWRYLRLKVGDNGSAVAVFTLAINILDPQDLNRRLRTMTWCSSRTG